MFGSTVSDVGSEHINQLRKEIADNKGNLQSSFRLDSINSQYLNTMESDQSLYVKRNQDLNQRNNKWMSKNKLKIFKL